MPGESSESLPPEEEIRPISLIDHTRTTDAHDDRSSDNESSIAQSPSRLSKRISAVPSLRDQRNRWKYARFSLERAEGNRGDHTTHAGQTDGGDTSLASSTWGMNPLDRSRQRLHNKFRPRRLTKSSNGPDTRVDVLFENQRGLFMFGIPFFSSNALGPWDAPSWADCEFRKSRVNITNAQVPDPSWAWTWKNWYVDMGGDVDEEGWEYSFFFKGFAWHGTHPWFHSFVRRRCWIRKRSRNPPHQFAPDKVFGNAHMMNQDYFTIHPGDLKTIASGARSPASENTAGKGLLSGKPLEAEERDSWDDREIQDLGTLIQGLREVPVDSERITLIRRFLEQGGDDLYYLADEMPRIMSHLFYESSCRRLLALLTDAIDEAKKRREEHTRKDEPEDENETRKIESLLKAAKSVDDQCKNLEYWSDVRELNRCGREVTSTRDALGVVHDGQDSDTSHVSEDNAVTVSERDNDDEKEEFDLDKEFEKGMFSWQSEENGDESEQPPTQDSQVDRIQEPQPSQSQDDPVVDSSYTPGDNEGDDAEEEDLQEIEPVPETSEQDTTSG